MDAGVSGDGFRVFVEGLGPWFKVGGLGFRVEGLGPWFKVRGLGLI